MRNPEQLTGLAPALAETAVVERKHREARRDEPESVGLESDVVRSTEAVRHDDAGNPGVAWRCAGR